MRCATAKEKKKSVDSDFRRKESIENAISALTTSIQFVVYFYFSLDILLHKFNYVIASQRIECTFSISDLKYCVSIGMSWAHWQWFSHSGNKWTKSKYFEARKMMAKPRWCVFEFHLPTKCRICSRSAPINGIAERITFSCLSLSRRHNQKKIHTLTNLWHFEWAEPKHADTISLNTVIYERWCFDEWWQWIRVFTIWLHNRCLDNAFENLFKVTEDLRSVKNAQMQACETDNKGKSLCVRCINFFFSLSSFLRFTYFPFVNRNFLCITCIFLYIFFSFPLHLTSYFVLTQRKVIDISHQIWILII